MSDLCARLKIAAVREEDERQRDGFCGDAKKSLYWAAADRIAELEQQLAALQEECKILVSCGWLRLGTSFIDSKEWDAYKRMAALLQESSDEQTVMPHMPTGQGPTQDGLPK